MQVESTATKLSETQGELEKIQKAYEDERTQREGERAEAERRWDAERRELRKQVDELRMAGQETIELYESKLDEIRKELNSSSATELSRSRSSSQSEPTLVEDADISTPTTSSESEELSYLSQKVLSLTDALSASQSLHQSDLSSLTSQLHTNRAHLKSLRVEMDAEVARLEGEVRELEREVEGERRRRGEVEEALRESGEALEQARGEVEALQTQGEALDQALDQATTATKELDAAKEEIAGLKHLVKELERQQRVEERERERSREDSGEAEFSVLREENRVLRGQVEELRKNTGSNLDLAEAAVNGTGGDDQSLRKEIQTLEAKIAQMEVAGARKTHDVSTYVFVP